METTYSAAASAGSDDEAMAAAQEMIAPKARGLNGCRRAGLHRIVTVELNRV